MKPAVHLCQELAGVVALGGAVMVYLQPERTGRLPAWQHDILAEVSRFCRERQTVCHKTETASETAILHLPETLYAHNEPLYNLGRAHAPVEGALHAMVETGRSVDLLCRDRVFDSLSRYRLVILARQDRIGDDVLTALKDYVTAGGRLLMTGTHLSHAFPDLVGADPAGAMLDRHIPLETRGRSAMLWAPWQPVTPRPGTETVRRALRRDDPSAGVADQVLITCRTLGQGKVMAVHGNLFDGYAADHSPRVRELIDELVDALDIPWQVRHNGPPWCELIVQRRADRLVINLINRGAADSLTPEKPIVESIAPLRHLTVTVRLENRPTRVCLTPAAPADWQVDNDRLILSIDTVPIHCAIEIELETPSCGTGTNGGTGTA